MVSIVIRNKNESKALERMLPILLYHYQNDFSEIILVDNNSTDNSVAIAKKHRCKIESISDFTYGKAINLGIAKAKNNFVLILSAHTIPIGASFFKTAMNTFKTNSKVAGIRFINSMANYERAHKLNYIVSKPLENGLMAACAIINKEVWQSHKFDESLMFSEDKEWSQRVVGDGFIIKEVAETFFYFAKRNEASILNRYINENVANSILKKEKHQTYFKIFGSSLFNMTFQNAGLFFKKIGYEFKMLKAKLKIRKEIKNHSQK